MKTIMRVIASLLVLSAIGWANVVLTSVGTIGAGNAAGGQFQSSDSAYVISQLGMRFFSGLFIPWIIGALGLLAIWWSPLRRNKKMINKAKKALSGLTVVLLALMLPVSAKAYYDKTDYAEPYFIMPNESAFWVPDVGDNKNAQVKFGSKEYFEANKIAAKRFVIPHVKLENSGLFSNFYVPAGRLILVDRTPYSREWVDSETKGSSSKHEGFQCQSKEGLNITVGIAIGVSVMEENAASFLYRFGVNPPQGDRRDPNVTFTSVLHSRSLTQVMDSVGRNKVQALVCNEIGSRGFDQANNEATKIMEATRTAAEKYLATVGITLDYLGWADTMEFDAAVQKAINDRYVAEKIAPVMATLTQNAQNSVLEGLGKGLATKGLPSNLVAIPESLMNLQTLFGGAKSASLK